MYTFYFNIATIQNGEFSSSGFPQVLLRALSSLKRDRLLNHTAVTQPLELAKGGEAVKVGEGESTGYESWHWRVLQLCPAPAHPKVEIMPREGTRTGGV